MRRAFARKINIDRAEMDYSDLIVDKGISGHRKGKVDKRKKSNKRNYL